jgi:hypothetical protein
LRRDRGSFLPSSELDRYIHRLVYVHRSIDSWDEQTYREADDGSKFTKAAVAVSADEMASGEGVSAASFDSVMYYRPDGTSDFVVIMQVTATLAGRLGSFALSGDGDFRDGTARMRLHVIEGSGSGELRGLTGRLESVSTHADYPFMPLTLHYDLT